MGFVISSGFRLKSLFFDLYIDCPFVALHSRVFYWDSVL